MEIKFNCTNPQCQQRLSVDAARAGQALVCPACATRLQVPASTSIKFNCRNEACGQHMVVDVAEAGRFVPCPACGKPTQVPGAPAKPMVASRPVGTPITGPGLAPPKKRKLPPVLIPFLRLLLGWGLGAAVCGLVIGGWHLHSLAALPANLNALLDETYFHGEILSAPVENHAGTALLYVRTIEAGAGVFLVNLTTLERTQIALGKVAAKDRGGSVKLFGWSPDDGYLAFATITNGNASQHLVICDGQTGKEINAFEDPQPVEMGSWLTPNSLVLLGDVRKGRALSVLNLAADDQLGKFGGQGFVELRKLERTASGLVVDSGRSVAYAENGKVWSLNLPANRAVQLTQLTNATLAGLDYSPASRKYLLDVVDGETKQHQLFQCDDRAGAGPPVAVSHPDYAFKGQWLPDGVGMAYVGAAGHGNYLVVSETNQGFHTNLFTFPELDAKSGLLSQKVFPEGRQVVRSYSLSPKGDKIYTVASLNYEPLGIWEYDLASQHLRQVVPIKEHSVHSQFIAPVQAATTNSFGQKVDYYYLPPAGLDPRKKYPVYMDQYSDLGFQPSSQFIANAGIFFVTASPYGNGVPKLRTEPANTVAVYQEMLKNPNVDPHRIYVGGERDGTSSVASLLANYPDYWRGAVVLSPLVLQQGLPGARLVPSIFFSFGLKDSDFLKRKMEEYSLTACGHHAYAQIEYGNDGHVFFSVDEIKRRYLAVVTFILEDR